MKKSYRTYIRTFYITWVLILCLMLGFGGIAKAYENTVRTGFGEYKKAVEISDGTLRILDFEIRFW